MLRNFVMDTIHKMIGSEPEYKVRQYALGWLDRDVLFQSDLVTVEDWLAEAAAAAQEEAAANEDQ